MRALLWLMTGLVAGLVGLGAASASAQGPMLDPLPGNTCPSAKRLKLLWIANGVASDGGFGGPAYAETMIVCHSTEKTGRKNIDVWVEMYDSAGTSVATASRCDVKPGAAAAFVTGFMTPPYIGQVVGPAAVVPPGSLRIMATKPKIACDVTLFDTGGATSGFSPGPVWTKSVTLTKAKAPQNGD